MIPLVLSLMLSFAQDWEKVVFVVCLFSLCLFLCAFFLFWHFLEWDKHAFVQFLPAHSRAEMGQFSPASSHANLRHDFVVKLVVAQYLFFCVSQVANPKNV